MSVLNVSFASIVPVPVSTCMLFSLHVNRKNQIVLWGSKQLMAALRTRLDGKAVPGSVLRVHGFDFQEVKRDRFVGIADDSDNLARRALDLANAILAAYRSMILFERVFAEDGSLNNFMMFHRRAPSSKEVQELARQKNIHVPYLELPFKSPLLQAAAPIAAPKPILTKPLQVVKKDGTRRLVLRRETVAPARLAELANKINSKYNHV